MNEITLELLERFRAQEAGRKELKTLQAAMAKTELKDLAFIPAAAARLNGDFSLELKTRGVTWQQKSGRCWLYAVLNILREKLSETLGLDKFELSANYLSFYDKLEKANNFLELVIENAHKPLNDRMMEYVLGGVGDGGYWDMATDLVAKYGVVPAWVMPETWQSTHTEKFLKLLNSLLRKDAMRLRAVIAAGGDAQAEKEAMLEEVYRMACIAFGEPPKRFDFEYRDKDGVFHAERGLSGRSFYEKYLPDALDEYVTVTNHPTHGLPMNLYYVFHYMGNMANRDVINLNLSVEEMEELTVKQLRDGEPVWFGCDSGAYGDREKGVWDPESLDYSGLLGGVDFSMSKGDRLESHDSFATHAMIFVGVNFDEDGRPDRWKIENSWGEEVGKKGYFVCSERYFRDFVYEVIVRKKHLTEAQRALLAGEPRRIQPWEGDWL
ncbi:MAG: C1 family peptidase [Oscillospiraceae bacterium]|nr:C1 family peptidase [Oscillospiraceae bacterium]MBR7009519.1 C1 family peptidase [Oscillospiraceae bacterium]